VDLHQITFIYPSSPFFVLLLWVFYDETVVAKNYGIKVADFVYYFLF